MIYNTPHYIEWKLDCISDGSALSATDLVSTMMTTQDGQVLLDLIRGGSLLTMKVSPGTGGEVPNTTINVTLSDAQSNSIWADTGLSYTAYSRHDLTKDNNNFPIPVMEALYLAINDIGDSGDKVTLYFSTWVE